MEYVAGDERFRETSESWESTRDVRSSTLTPSPTLRARFCGAVEFPCGRRRGSKAGDRFSAQVLAPDTYDGAIIEGRIASIKAAKNRDKAEIAFQFETLTFQNATHRIQADLKEVANSQGVKNVDEEGRAIGKSPTKSSS